MMEAQPTGFSRPSRSSFARLITACVLVAGTAGLALAVSQDSEPKPTATAATPKAQDGAWYRVTGRNVNVRCSPNVSGSYAMGRLQKDDRVFVTVESNGWATIRTTGPSFDAIHGLLRADNQVQEGGDTVEVLSIVPLMAPNMPAKNDPARSWKRLATLAPGTVLKIDRSFTNDIGNRYLLVSLPETANVYVNMAFLAPEKISAPTPVQVQSPKEEPKPEPKPMPMPVQKPTLIEKPTPTATPMPKEVVVVVPEPVTPAPVPSETTDAVFVIDEEGSSAAQEIDPLADVTLEQAEDAWAELKRDGGMDAEIETLQLIYTVIATRADAPAEEKHIAELRIRQLELKREVQERLRRLQAMRERNTVDRDRMKNAQILIDARAAYDAVGRLNASRVYDGKRLPTLYRLSAPSGGRTIGYIRPSDDMNLLPMLGRLVGIVGTKNYDAGYRLMIINPKRIDILTANATE